MELCSPQKQDPVISTKLLGKPLLQVHSPSFQYGSGLLCCRMQRHRDQAPLAPDRLLAPFTSRPRRSARSGARPPPRGAGSVRMRGGPATDLGRGGARRDANGGSMTGGGKRRQRAAEPEGEQVGAGERAGGWGRRVRRVRGLARGLAGRHRREGGRELC